MRPSRASWRANCDLIAARLVQARPHQLLRHLGNSSAIHFSIKGRAVSCKLLCGSAGGKSSSVPDKSTIGACAGWLGCG